MDSKTCGTMILGHSFLILGQIFLSHTHTSQQQQQPKSTPQSSTAPQGGGDCVMWCVGMVRHTSPWALLLSLCVHTTAHILFHLGTCSSMDRTEPFVSLCSIPLSHVEGGTRKSRQTRSTTEPFITHTIHSNSCLVWTGCWSGTLLFFCCLTPQHTITCPHLLWRGTKHVVCGCCNKHSPQHRMHTHISFCSPAL